MLLALDLRRYGNFFVSPTPIQRELWNFKVADSSYSRNYGMGYFYLSEFITQKLLNLDI